MDPSLCFMGKSKCGCDFPSWVSCSRDVPITRLVEGEFTKMYEGININIDVDEHGYIQIHIDTEIQL